tara:strand:+ start:215 stop:1393 length:1179 start_codon:yes stop_codon:yes gene_type:complete
MAINVNTVYQTVLLILNKEQRGYMTPLEFNKIGAQVQLEIFERYFEDLNQQIRIPQTDTDYADRVVSLDEKISIFKRYDNTIYSNGSFSLPRLSTPLTQSFSTTGQAAYTVNNISASQLAEQVTVTLQGNAVTNFTLTNNIITFGAASIPPTSLTNVLVTLGTGSAGGGTAPANSTSQITLYDSAGPYPVGYNISSSSTANAGVPVITEVTGPYLIAAFEVSQITFSVPQAWPDNGRVSVTGTVTVTSAGANVYKLGTVVYTNGALPQQELQRVDRGEIFHLNSSNLTKPSTTYPVYLYENNRIIVYPTIIQSGISASYIKKPLDPVWNFTLGGSQQYVYDGNGSTDFELHPAEQTEVVLKTLLYAGVVIKDPQIIQIAAQQVAQEQMNQKS